MGGEEEQEHARRSPAGTESRRRPGRQGEKVLGTDSPPEAVAREGSVEAGDNTHRKLKSRHIQLIG